jgi:hypothetical protein
MVKKHIDTIKTYLNGNAQDIIKIFTAILVAVATAGVVWGTLRVTVKNNSEAIMLNSFDIKDIKNDVMDLEKSMIRQETLYINIDRTMSDIKKAVDKLQ